MVICVVTEKQLSEYKEKGERFACAACQRKFRKTGELVFRKITLQGKVLYAHVTCSDSTEEGKR